MNPNKNEDDLRPEYDFDFSKAERGKYYRQYAEGTNVVVLDPDVATAFRDSAAVNDALRAMLRLTKQVSTLTVRSSHDG
uniref:Uncharacterized protein n=1 Tax=Candidatus Kentrum sp. TC TaxID=2126339 RepID=A0A450ZD80_9GAMM|nr:MAG: hypothetical protein BECKTC1821D_GA0114238_11388 [Candidatus Kentron sp. TC]